MSTTRTIEALEAEVERLTRAWQAMQLAKGKAEASEKEVWNERETLRAQLAAAQGQGPIHWVVPHYGFTFPTEEAAQQYQDNLECADRPIACYSAPIPQQASVPAECCEHCDDGDGLCVFPMYGPAPHTHDTSSGWIGSTRTLPKDQWGNNFREDPDCEGHGVYMRCEKCGRGEQPAAAAPQPKETK